MATEAAVNEVKLLDIHPQLLEDGKVNYNLVHGEALDCMLSVAANGGEMLLHKHAGEEAIWLVLQGEATFHTEGDEILHVVRKFQAIYLPEGQPYWFECTSTDENLVIMRFGARVPGKQPEMVRLGEWKYRNKPAVPKEGAFFGS